MRRYNMLVLVLLFFVWGNLLIAMETRVPEEGRVRTLLALAAHRIVQLAQEDGAFLAHAQEYIQQSRNNDIASVLGLELENEARFAPAIPSAIKRKNYVKTLIEGDTVNFNVEKVFCELGVGNFLITHKQFIKTSIFSPDNLFVLSGSNDGTMKLWSVLTGQEVTTIRPGGSEDIWTQALKWKGDLIASAHWKNYVHIWNAAEMREGRGKPSTITLPGGTTHAIDISPREPLLAVIVDDKYKKELLIYNMLTNIQIQTIRLEREGFGYLAWSPDGTMLAITRAGNIGILDVATWQMLCLLPVNPLCDFGWCQEDTRTFLLVEQPSDGVQKTYNHIKIDLSLLRSCAGQDVAQLPDAQTSADSVTPIQPQETTLKDGTRALERIEKRSSCCYVS